MAPPLKSLVGRPPFGRLTVVAYAGRAASSRNSLWDCDCSCGGKALAVPGNELKRGSILSCGCLQTEHLATTGRKANERGHNQKIWPHACPTCGREFLGTARQRYCMPEHRKK